MVINFGIVPSKGKEDLEKLYLLKDKQDILMQQALQLINEDCVVFIDLMASITNKSDTPDKYETAATVPLKICRVARESMKIAGSVMELVKGAIVSDIACSRQILISAFYSAEINVKMNLKGIGPGRALDRFLSEIKELKAGIEKDAAEIDERLFQRGILKGDSK